MLAAERERQGLSISEVASRLRLHPRQVSAIESERLDELPQGTFLRGFIRNYAKELRLDPAPLLEELQRRLPAGPCDMPERAGTAAPLRDARRDRMSRALVIGGAIAALALFAIVGWVAKREVPAEPQTVSSSQEQATPAASVGEAQPPQTSAPDTAVPAAEEPAHKGQEMPKPTETAASPEKTEDVAAAEATTTAAQSGSLALRFVFGTQPSWIEVTQADGSIVYSGLNEAGTERRVVGQPPLKLVVGNASTVTLESHGKPVELAPHIRSNDLARLTIE